MRTSPSQLVTALDCDRKWAFDKLFKIGDGKDPAARDIGTILHACAERFLSADDQGRIPTPTDPVELAFGKWTDKNHPLFGQKFGDPVDMFPDGWEKVLEWGKDTGRRISLQQQAVVRVLIKQAIDNNTLRRLPDREVEVHYEVPVDTVDGATMQGYVDLDTPREIDDHKTTKRKGGKNPVTGKTRKGYALTSAKLKKDPKMLCYAYFKWRSRQFPIDDQGTPNPLKDEPILLRLNYFSKEQDAEPWSVEASVKPADVIQFWGDTVIPAVRRMAELTSLVEEGKLTVDQWDEIEGPNDNKACEAYGGCSFAKICSRVSTVERHKKTVERLQLQYQGKKPERASSMGFFERNKKGGAAASKPTVAPENPDNERIETTTTPQATIGQRGSPTQVAEIADEEPMVATATVPTDTPPWAVDSCRACKGTGFSKTGAPCKACDLVSGRTGGKTSSQFEIWVDDSGDTRWKEAGGQATEPARKAEAKAEAPKTAEKATPKTSKPKASGKGTNKAKAKETPKKTADDPKKEPPVAEANKALQEAGVDLEVRELKTGFDLYVGCIPLGHPRTITLSDILHREGAELAQASNKSSFYELDAFARRDAMAAQAQAIADSIKGYALICPGATITPDERILLAALEPLAAYKVVTLV